MKSIQFTLALLVVLLVALPLSDAWMLQMYDKNNYKGKRIHYDRETNGGPCRNLPRSAKNKANSLKFTLNVPCRAMFYDSDNCKGKLLLKTGHYKSWKGNLGKNANKINSYDTSCFW
jgi:hypothetical protein